MKTKSVTFRVTEEEYRILNLLTEKSKASVSDLIRNAVTQYYNLYLDIPGKPGGQVIFHSDMLRHIISCCKDDEIKQLAQISFNTGMQEDLVDREIKKDFRDPNNPDNFEHQLHMLTQYVFSPTGQRWMIKAEYLRNQNQFTFGGRHVLGKNFSLFIRYLLELFANYYHFEVQKAETDIERIVLIFAPISQKTNQK